MIKKTFTGEQYQSKCSRYQSVKWVWIWHIWYYSHTFQGPMNQNVDRISNSLNTPHVIPSPRARWIMKNYRQNRQNAIPLGEAYPRGAVEGKGLIHRLEDLLKVLWRPLTVLCETALWFAYHYYISRFYQGTAGEWQKKIKGGVPFSQMLDDWYDQIAYNWWKIYSWWRHQMEIFSALLTICAGNSPIPGEFPAQRPVTRSFGGSFDMRLNKRLRKQSWGWWF